MLLQARVIPIQNHRLLHLCIGIWVIFDIFSKTKAVSTFQKYTTTGFTKLWSSKRIYTESKIECAMYCSRNKECRGSSYNSFTGRCRLDDGSTCKLTTAVSTNSVFMTPLQNKDFAWKTEDGRTFCCGTRIRTWNNAEIDCQKEGAHLVKIEDSNKQAWLEQVILDDPVIDHTWIGATDVVQEGQWIWESDQTMVIYTKWYWYEPNNNYGNQHCAVIGELMNFNWFDRKCTEHYDYICEK